MTEQTTTLTALRAARPAEVKAGFDTAGGFDLMQRVAKAFAQSDIVPVTYRYMVKDKKGKKGDDLFVPNQAALSNCIVAVNMAQRMGADPLMVMQNLYIVEGRPAWSSQFIIAMINACGRYSPLRFDLSAGEEREVEYTVKEWANGQSSTVTKKTTIQERTCTAWAIEKETGTRLESPPVTMEMAVKEGWYSKTGSKWQTMPEMMLRYRAAAFFGRLYAPELLMGISTEEEVSEIIDITPQEPAPAPAPEVSLQEMKEAAAAMETYAEVDRTVAEYKAEAEPVEEATKEAQPPEAEEETVSDATEEPAPQVRAVELTEDGRPDWEGWFNGAMADIRATTTAAELEQWRRLHYDALQNLNAEHPDKADKIRATIANRLP